MEVETSVIEIISTITGREKISINDSLIEDLGMDSLMMVMLLIDLEDGLGIELEESDMNPFDLVKVEDVIALAEKYCGRG